MGTRIKKARRIQKAELERRKRGANREEKLLLSLQVTGVTGDDIQRWKAEEKRAEEARSLKQEAKETGYQRGSLRYQWGYGNNAG
jgi:hypothetical protein